MYINENTTLMQFDAETHKNYIREVFQDGNDSFFILDGNLKIDIGTCACQGDLKTFKRLIGMYSKFKSNFYYEEIDFNLILSYASYHDNLDIVKYIIEDMKINFYKDNCFSFRTASLKNSIKTIEYFLYNLNIDISDNLIKFLEEKNCKISLSMIMNRNLQKELNNKINTKKVLTKI
jgi:hypothetical protein